MDGRLKTEEGRWKMEDGSCEITNYKFQTLDSKDVEVWLSNSPFSSFVSPCLSILLLAASPTPTVRENH